MFKAKNFKLKQNWKQMFSYGCLNDYKTVLCYSFLHSPLVTHISNEVRLPHFKGEEKKQKFE